MDKAKKRMNMLRPRLRKRPKPGAVPGTLQIDKQAQKPEIEVIAFSAEEHDRRKIESPDEIRPMIDQWPVVWVNVNGLGDADTIRAIGDIFELHPLVLEDVVHVDQRPKVELYDNLMFIVVRMANMQPPFETEQMSMLVGNGFVVTFQERPGDVFGPIRNRLKTIDSTLRKRFEADYLAYRLIDAVIDGYFPMLEHLGNRLDEIDMEVTHNPDQEIIGEIHQLKADLLLARRTVWPHRDAVNQLARDANRFVSESTRTYFRDVYDHTVQLIDLVETYRDICGDLRDYCMTALSNKMNEIMKVLTVISTIFIPLSFVTGLYGMNFDTDSPYNMPELDWRLGYPFALSIMGAMTVGLLFFFWRKGWLRTDNHARDKENTP